MDIRVTRNEHELLRAIVANRLDNLVTAGTDPDSTPSHRKAALHHIGTVGDLLILLDEQETDDGE